MFLIYVLVRCLQDKQPTAVQVSSKSFVLFTTLGAQCYPIAGFPENCLPPGIWALTDSSDDVTRPCLPFLRAQATLIYVISPARNRWGKWERKYDADLYIMDPWAESELGALLWVSVGSQG
ncbi:hypothetical protein OBBRIDRAFT_793196, partial [Obba rivulosa]